MSMEGTIHSGSQQIMVVAGEVSGDIHGANLVLSIKSLRPDLKICGMGGTEMAAVGVQMLCDNSKLAVMGITEVVGRLWDIRKSLKTLEDNLQKRTVDLLVLIDYPGFNLILAKKANKLNIPVLYYISPKVWAWNTRRVNKLKKFVDKMAVILPFEKDFYAQFGMDVEFVGNPLLDQVKRSSPRDHFLNQHNIDPSVKVVGILPGSRRQEIRRMLPVFLDAAKQMKMIQEKLVFLVALAPGLSMDDIMDAGLSEEEHIKVISGDRYDLMASCDAVIAASGTVALELAILNVPMVVAYRMSPLTYFLARRLVKISYVSLVNLVAGSEVVKELLQEDASPGKISRELLSLLNDKKTYLSMKEKLKQVSSQLGTPGASGRVAKLAMDML